MNHLLVNGCSYGYSWTNAHELSERLGYDKCTNLSIPGSSNDRIFRSTVNFLLDNPDVDFVIVMLTFIFRFEAPLADQIQEYEGRFVSFSHSGINPMTQKQRMPSYSQTYMDRINQCVMDKFVFDVYGKFTDHSEKFLINLMLLTSWLDSKNINYCIFNTAEDDLQHYIKTQKIDQLILSEIRKNKKIIDIDNFMSNQYMLDQGCQINQRDIEEYGLPPLYTHFKSDGYKKLNEFLYDYITKHCL
jgi:hypothetical protein